MQYLRSFIFISSVLNPIIYGVSLSQEPYDHDLSDRYIISLRPGANMLEHMHHVRDVHVRSLARRQDNQVFKGVSHWFNISDFSAYAGHFEETVIEQLKRHEDVARVEPDKMYTIAASQIQHGSSYGLGLISHRGNVGADEGYVYDSSAGAGTWAYVVDTGINVVHREFQLRASNGYNAIRGTRMEDTSGHGTHLAGIIGGRTYGVAKRTNLIAVKVLKNNQGPASAILDGYQWAANDILDHNRQSKAVINLAIGAGDFHALNSAISTAYRNGITTVVSFASDEEHPIWPRNAIAVAATDQRRRRASFSETGSRLTLFAPGVSIRSAWIGSYDAVKTGSGNSQAAAHVSGLVVYLKGLRRLPDAQQTKQSLIMLALPNVVGNAGDAPNLFAYNGSGR
ncbi:alkaline protease [Myriangium duriaei CBS 260.36]|uniref:Alkaline protease n=1 Tax=Myriangium duriaei CBS 260.36 TaxID=1168546 RepID=A0A9P4IVY0_9PEZI|nr:alkaline protease [Myriangium duriaei CBS 260.36]